jgi:hypothetical protein
MITAKNYAAQAESGVIDFCESMKRNKMLNFSSDISACELMQYELKRGVHFAIPDYGVILDTGCSGIRSTEIKLPFPLITAEYFVPTNNIKNENQVEVKKRVLIAKEIDSKIAISLGIISLENIQRIRDCERIIMVSACYYSEEHGMWTPHPWALVVPSKWDETQSTSRRYGVNSDGVGFVGIPFRLLPAGCSMLESYLGREEAESVGVDDVAGEVAVLLELLEALSCKNVEQSVLQPASPKNAQRIKSHKLPIYETKFLTIKASTSKTESNKTGFASSHASPRQHLRRGHIRRLESGNIWVNSCVVGDSEKGVINKQYRVKA